MSPFVQLLWERGAAHEKEVIAGIGDAFLDLSKYDGVEKERLTLAAMDRGESLIYSGRISSDDLLGEPDLLRKEGKGYVAGDIKSGAGEEGASEEHDGKPKIRYAVQLALYTDILERLGQPTGRTPFVWDIHRTEVPYDLMEVRGKKNPRRLWDDYEEGVIAITSTSAVGRARSYRTVITNPPRQYNSTFSFSFVSMPIRNDCHGSGMDLDGMA